MGKKNRRPQHPQHKQNMQRQTPVIIASSDEVAVATEQQKFSDDDYKEYVLLKELILRENGEVVADIEKYKEEMKKKTSEEIDKRVYREAGFTSGRS